MSAWKTSGVGVNNGWPTSKVPRYIDLRLELPTTATGRVNKAQLRGTPLTSTTRDRRAAPTVPDDARAVMMAISWFPVEAGHIFQFARAIGDPNPVYRDPHAAATGSAGGIIAPPTFVEAGQHFDPDFVYRPEPGRAWFGSARGTERRATAGRGGTHSASRRDSPALPSEPAAGRRVAHP